VGTVSCRLDELEAGLSRLEEVRAGQAGTTLCRRGPDWVSRARAGARPEVVYEFRLNLTS